MRAEKDPEKPGLLDRLRARYRVVRPRDAGAGALPRQQGRLLRRRHHLLHDLRAVPVADGRFRDRRVRAGEPARTCSAEIDDKIKQTVSGDLGEQLVELIDSAIDSRTSVGIIGLAAALWAGLGWMANLREALTAMWEQRAASRSFVRTKLSDLVALLSMFVAIVVTVGLTAVSSSGLMRTVLGWLGLQDVPGSAWLLQIASVLTSLLISWLLFTWMIARLPRESLSLRSAARAGLMAAVGFEVFKQLGSVYLQDRSCTGRRVRRSARCWVCWCSPTSPRGWCCSRPRGPPRRRKTLRQRRLRPRTSRSSRRGTWAPRASAWARRSSPVRWEPLEGWVFHGCCDDDVDRRTCAHGGNPADFSPWVHVRRDRRASALRATVDRPRHDDQAEHDHRADDRDSHPHRQLVHGGGQAGAGGGGLAVARRLRHQ